jgi:hypothetical protein
MSDYWSAMSFLPPDFGGFLSVWDPDPDYIHALVVRYGHGEVQEGLHLTPLNLLQLRAQLDSLIAQGEVEGFITDEHHHQSQALPVIVAPADEVANLTPTRDDVDEITGE